MKLTWTNISIFIILFFLIGLTIYVVRKPSEVFENKSPEEAYLDWVSHTEYIAGDSQGQAIIRVTDYRGRPLNASCNLTLVYPNHTYVFTDAVMSPSIVFGNYYRYFIVPNTFGVYTEFVNCSVEVRPSLYIEGTSSNSIHVNPAFDFLVNISQNITQIQQQLNNISTSIGNLSQDMNNNFTYTNSLIGNISSNITLDLNYTNTLIINSTNNITENITSFRNEAYTWYITLRNDIYNCCQRWIDALNDLVSKMGLGQIIQRLPTGGGVTQKDSIWKKIIGGD